MSTGDNDDEAEQKHWQRTMCSMDANDNGIGNDEA